MSRIAINGFGRIGRSLMKVALKDGLFVPVSIDAESPERGHLSSRSECLRVLKPNWHPFLPQLKPNVFEVRTNLILVLH